jgi:SNF2 family DNA or RNA helicase
MINESNLWPYQEHSREHIIDEPFCGLFLEMGLGKTVTTLSAINRLIFNLDVSKVLIIAPKRVAESVWIQEAEKWEHLKNLRFSKVTGTEKQREKALKVDADVYLLGRDNVVWLCGLYGGAFLPFDMLIVDESSSFKNPKSIRFKALRKVRTSFSRIVLLTGTPAPNGLLDIWPQIFLLDGGQRLGRFITHFRDEYFKPDARNGATVFSHKLRGGCESAIYEKIEDIVISMKAEDYLDLPGRVVNDIIIDFPSKVAKMYDDFKNDMVLQILIDDLLDGNGEISALTAAALSNKLLQFTNGAVYDENRAVHEFHDLKLDALEEVVEGLSGRPVLVAVNFKHDTTRIKKRFPKLRVEELKNQQTIDDWNAGEIDLLVMHPASGGHGLNLQKGGNNVVWFGLNWGLELYQQLNARLDRQGQTAVVYIHRILIRGTIDQKVGRRLEGKAEKQDNLMSAVKAELNNFRK